VVDVDTVNVVDGMLLLYHGYFYRILTTQDEHANGGAYDLTAQQVADSRSWYNPQWHYDNDAETSEALDLIFSDHFSRSEPGVFAPLRDMLLT